MTPAHGEDMHQGPAGPPPEGAPARERWNRRYAQEWFRPFPDRPVEWLTDNAGTLELAPGRRALDVACGDGRNAAYLAQLGFAVDAIDVSDVAIAALQAAAATAKLEVRATRIDLEREALPQGPYDLIVHFNYLQRELYAPLSRALAPGGLLVFETLLQAPEWEPSAAPQSRFALGGGELLAAFPSLHVLRYREGWATRTHRPRRVASLLARRPAGR